MGVVYKAEDTLLHRPVALKFLPVELYDNPDARQQFIQEARAASALDHPNICVIHEINETEDGRMFICMALCDGESLAADIARGPLDVQTACGFAAQIAQGLQAAHTAGITHGDIKPENVIITSSGLVKILDFGLARIGRRKPGFRKGGSVGTAAYMSPEQIRGERLDHRSDIWSLGVCLYEMLSGRLPFEGDYDPALFYAITTDRPLPLTELRKGACTQSETIDLQILENIVMRCLEKKPEHRYGSMAELAADLAGLHPEHSPARVHLARSSGVLARVLKRSLWAALIALVAIIIAIPIFRQSGELPPPGRKSIAVLPFQNLNENPENEYFCDGVTEDVITRLSKFADLTVISRTTVMQYKKTKKTIPEIARELNVGTILEGSVRRSGDRLRITSQLIDVRTDTHIWSETYDRQLKDVFVIQNDVAQKIAQALKITLKSEGVETAPDQATGDITAYEHYLKAREYYYRFTKTDNEYAIEQFKSAIIHDSGYAAAYAGLADAYSQRVAKFGFPPFWVDSAIELSKNAIALDPSLAEAHKALGLAYSGKGWHRRSAISYRHAIDLNPNYLTAANNLGVEYAFMGVYDSALMWYKNSLPLNPTFPFSYYTVGGIYDVMDDTVNALVWFGKCRDLQPDFQYLHSGLAMMYLRRGENTRAFSEAARILSVAPDDIEGLTLAGWAKVFDGEYAAAKKYFEKAITIDSTGTFWYGTGRSSTTALGYINLQLGQMENAKEMLLRSRQRDQAQLDQQSEWHTIRYDLAAVSALENKQGEALRWLRKAIDLGWRDFNRGQNDPLLKNISGTPEFKQMMSEVRAAVRKMRVHADSLNVD